MLFLRKAPAKLSISDLEARALLFLMWHNFGVDREGKLEVQAERSGWAEDDSVGILESFVGWSGEPGRLVGFAVDCGFLEVVPAGEGKARLVASGFSEVNRRPLGGASLSMLGGLNKARNRAEKEAERGAQKQMDLFKANDDPILKEYDPGRLQSAIVLIRQAARILRRVEPSDGSFLAQLVPKALAAMDAWGEEKDLVLSWLGHARDDDSLPGRMDLLLDAHEDLRRRAKDWRRGVEG